MYVIKYLSLDSYVRNILPIPYQNQKREYWRSYRNYAMLLTRFTTMSLSDSVSRRTLIRFDLLSLQGLITKDRKSVDPAAAQLAKSHGEVERYGLRDGSSLIEVVSPF